MLARLKIPGAWLAAAIFALHPVNVESVAWITERKNVLSVFFLLALLAWTEFIADDARKKWKLYVMALACCALALFAKTTACTLPAALFLILWLKHKPITLRRMVEIVPFLGLGVGMGLLTMWWERYHQGTHGKLFAMGFAQRLLVATHAVWFYAASSSGPRISHSAIPTGRSIRGIPSPGDGSSRQSRSPGQSIARGRTSAAAARWPQCFS